MPSGKKKSNKSKNKSWTENDVKFGTAGAQDSFCATEESQDDNRLTIATEENFANFYTPSIASDTKMETLATSEVTKSGRTRKKTAKLIEMEEVDMLEKVPRRAEPSKSKKSKMQRPSDHIATASLNASFAPSSSISEENDSLSPFVITNVFTMSANSDPQTLSCFSMEAGTPAAPKPKKVKPKKSSGHSNDGFADAFGSFSRSSADVELLRKANTDYDSEPLSPEPGTIINAVTPKKSPKKKSSVIPPFTIKLENTGEHSVIGSAAPSSYIANEISLPLADSFPGEFLSGLSVKEEAEIKGVTNGPLSVKKEKSKKKDKTGDLNGSVKAKKLKRLKIGKQLQTARKEMEKPKKKRQKGYTAYMLWCSVQRAKVVAQNPGIDFAQISKRLGDMWQTVPEKEKMTLRRKARRMAKKGSSLIKTGLAFKDEISAVETSYRKMLFNVKPSKMKVHAVDEPTLKVTSVDHVDVAAHLKLLGESLATIGARLQEHKGNIAVQGSLSVLLDSLLCTLGPLMCLTNQVPQLNGCSEDVHRGTLENIAYIMPGVG